MGIKLPELKCKRCGYEWIPRKEKVKNCPYCKSPFWNEEKKQPKKQELSLKDGWIKLHRRMLDSDIWKATKRKPFDKRSAWIDLLLRANHKKVTISI